MKVLVTGGSGLLGKAIQRYVHGNKDEHDYIFINSSNDLRDKYVTEKLIQEAKPDVVIHTAAKVGGLLDNMNNQIDYWVDNTEMNLNILRACKNHGIKRVISCLSTCIYPSK